MWGFRQMNYNEYFIPQVNLNIKYLNINQITFINHYKFLLLKNCDYIINHHTIIPYIQKFPYLLLIEKHGWSKKQLSILCINAYWKKESKFHQFLRLNFYAGLRKMAEESQLKSTSNIKMLASKVSRIWEDFRKYCCSDSIWWIYILQAHLVLWVSGYL